MNKEAKLKPIDKAMLAGSTITLLLSACAEAVSVTETPVVAPPIQLADETQSNLPSEIKSVLAAVKQASGDPHCKPQLLLVNSGQVVETVGLCAKKIDGQDQTSVVLRGSKDKPQPEVINLPLEWEVVVGGILFSYGIGELQLVPAIRNISEVSVPAQTKERVPLFFVHDNGDFEYYSENGQTVVYLRGLQPRPLQDLVDALQVEVADAMELPTAQPSVTVTLRPNSTSTATATVTKTPTPAASETETGDIELFRAMEGGIGNTWADYMHWDDQKLNWEFQYAASGSVVEDIPIPGISGATVRRGNIGYYYDNQGIRREIVIASFLRMPNGNIVRVGDWGRSLSESQLQAIFSKYPAVAGERGSVPFAYIFGSRAELDAYTRKGGMAPGTGPLYTSEAGKVYLEFLDKNADAIQRFIQTGEPMDLMIPSLSGGGRRVILP